MLTNIINNDLVVNARKLIDNAHHIVIIGHVSPDGDAVGASLALYHYLKEINLESTVIYPNRYPAFLNWMPGIDAAVIMEENHQLAVQLFKQADLICCVDFNSINRVNGMKPLIEQSSAKRIMLDHHTGPEEFCDVNISESQLSSTSELLFRLICRFSDFKLINSEMATCIYTGMMTDTGAFTYNSNNPEIYTIIHELLEKGVNKDAIYRRVYNTYSEDRMRLMGYCLNKKMTIYDKYHASVMVLTEDEQNIYNYQVGDSEGFVNLPLQIGNIDLSIFLRQDKDKIKMSFRSQGNLAVNKMAGEFGGGGHVNAAGGTSSESMEFTLRKLEHVIKNREQYEINV